MQMRIMPMGLENVIIMSDEAKNCAYDTFHSKGGVDSKEVGIWTEGKEKPLRAEESKIRGHGEQEFEALMRRLDNAVSFQYKVFFLYIEVEFYLN